MLGWLDYVKPGDWLVLLLACLGIGYSVAATWLRPAPDQLIVRSNGAIVARASLEKNARFAVPGKLGDSVVAIENRRARFVSDPGPRQICVHQGWLERAGDMALCLPNRTSIELAGNQPLYDSLNY